MLSHSSSRSFVLNAIMYLVMYCCMCSCHPALAKVVSADDHVSVAHIPSILFLSDDIAVSQHREK